MLGSGRGARRRRRVGGSTAPTQDGAQPGAQFAQVERLAHIVVGAEFEPDHPVHDLVGGGQHQDGDVARGLEPPGDRKAVLAGHVHVEHQDLGRLLPQMEIQFGAVRGRAHGKTMLAEILGHHRAQIGLVIDDDQAGVLRHQVRRKGYRNWRMMPLGSGAPTTPCFSGQRSAGM